MALIYSWINTILSRVNDTTKCETKLIYWENWFIKREIIQISEWKKKEIQNK